MFFPHPSSRHRPAVVSRCRHCLSSYFVASSTQVMCTCLVDLSALPTSSLRPAMADRRFFPTSSLLPVMACEQSVYGRPPRPPQHCSALIHEEQMTGPSATTLSFSNASITMFSTSLSAWLYAVHTRTSPPNSIHRHVLQPFANPRRVIAFTSRRTVHVCRNRNLIDRIELTLCASLNSLSQSC